MKRAIAGYILMLVVAYWLFLRPLTRKKEKQMFEVLWAVAPVIAFDLALAFLFLKWR